MFNVNRVMTISTDECILVHWNGKEIYCFADKWDILDCIKLLLEKINNKIKPVKFIDIKMNDINICKEALPLLYSVKQFTQIEELAFMNKDWQTLEKLLLQRIEDNDIF